MLEYDRIDFTEGIDANKTVDSSERLTSLVNQKIKKMLYLPKNRKL